MIVNKYLQLLLSIMIIYFNPNSVTQKLHIIKEVVRVNIYLIIKKLKYSYVLNFLQ